MRLNYLGVYGSVLLSAVAAHAGTTFTYTGTPFTTVEGSYSPSDFVSGTWTIAGPIPVNLTDAALNVTSFSISDQEQVLTPETGEGVLTNFVLSTDANGRVSAYSFFVDVYDGGSSYDREIGAFSFPASDPVGAASGSTGYDPDGEGQNHIAGTLTYTGKASAVTPEPSSIALLGTCVFGVGRMLRRRFR